MLSKAWKNIYNQVPTEIKRRKRKFRTEEDFEKWILKKEYKATHSSHIPPCYRDTSMMDDEHYWQDDDCSESFVKFGIIADSDDWTDEDVREWIDDQWRRVTSPYDCSGQLFTSWISWHRNPTGLISYQHHMSIDI